MSCLLKFKWFQILLEAKALVFSRCAWIAILVKKMYWAVVFLDTVFSQFHKILRWMLVSHIITSHHIFASDPYLTMHMSSSNLFKLCFESKPIMLWYIFFFLVNLVIANHPNFPNTSGTELTSLFAIIIYLFI